MIGRKKMRSERPRVWVVLHCEVALTLDGWVVDEDVFFAASSRGAAERLIRTVRVDTGSWWRVEVARLDDVEGTRADDRISTAYYSSSGKLIPSPPKKRGYQAAIFREKQAVKRIQKRLTTATADGLSKRVIANLESSLRSIRRVLSRNR